MMEKLRTISAGARQSPAWLDRLFDPDYELDSPWMPRVWLASLFILGVVLWGIFFNWGDFPLDYHDWAQINAPRLAFIKSAVEEQVFPLHMQQSAPLKSVTYRYFAIPDTPSSPQLLLLGVMAVDQFIFANILILYSLAFCGLLRFKRQFRLSLVTATSLFLLLLFNGHIVSHLAVGHFSWGGYFLLIWLFLFVMTATEANAGFSWQAVAGITLVQMLTLLQGSFHQFIWVWMLLGLMGLFHWRLAPTFAAAFAFSLLAGAFRILPALQQQASFDLTMWGGYPSGIEIIRAMLFERVPDTRIPLDGSGLRWWEFNLFIGYAGFLFLLGWISLWVRQQVTRRSLSAFLLPVAVMTYLSIGDNYQWLFELPLPGFASERVTSRFIIIPFFALVLVGAVAFDRWQTGKRAIWLRLGVLTGMLYLAQDLVFAFERWSVAQASKVFPKLPLDLAQYGVGNYHDPAYETTLIIGGVVSLLGASVAVALALRERRNKPSELVHQIPNSRR